jgi:hypothetical protein
LASARSAPNDDDVHGNSIHMVFSTVLQPMLIISDVVVELVVDTAVVRSIEEDRRCRNDEVEGNSIHMGFSTDMPRMSILSVICRNDEVEGNSIHMGLSTDMPRMSILSVIDEMVLDEDLVSSIRCL